MHSLNIDRFIAVNCYRSSSPLLWAEELTAIRRKVNCYQEKPLTIITHAVKYRQ